MFGFWLRVGNSKSPRVKTFESSKKLKTQKLESKKEKRAKEDKEAGTNNNRVFWQIEKRHLPHRILFLKLMKRHFENSEIFVSHKLWPRLLLPTKCWVIIWSNVASFRWNHHWEKRSAADLGKGHGSLTGHVPGHLNISSDKSTSDNLRSWIFKISYSAIFFVAALNQLNLNQMIR